MDYSHIINKLAEKRLALGWSEGEVAVRARLPQSTVHRILTGGTIATFGKLWQLAGALGIDIGIVEETPAEIMLYNQAKTKALAIAQITQATSQLEGQGLGEGAQEELVRKLTREILASETKKK